MEQLVLVRCEKEDLATLKEIGIETYTDTFAAHNTDENMVDYLTTAYADDKLLTELATAESSFYFLKKTDEIVGYLKLNVGQAQTETIADNSLEVERIYIRTKHHNGYGKYLIQFAQEKARQLKKDSLWLGVWEHNLNARGFYEKMGFHRVGEHVFVMGDDAQTDFILLKELSKESI